MAPNVPLQVTMGDSEEISGEVIDVIPALVPEVPKSFQPRVDQQFQNQNNPNLKQITSFSPNTNSRPKTEQQLSSRRVMSLRPRLVQEEVIASPEGVTIVEEVAGGRLRNNNEARRRFNGAGSQQSESVLLGTLLPPTVPTLSSNPEVSSVSPNGRNLDINPPRSTQVPRRRTFGRVPQSGLRRPTKENSAGIPAGENRLPKEQQTTTTTQATSTVSSTQSHIELGVLKLPGHEPEAPADLVLIHHDRTINTKNQTGEGGIFVKDDSNYLTSEGATALILVGLCSVFLVFICFIMFIQKIRRHKIESKVGQDEPDLKAPGKYEVAGTTMYHPNPLSFLTPDILNALLHPTGVTKSLEEPKPSFLTMEPPLSGNQLGRLWFSVFYDYMKSTLVLRILHARYMKGRGSSTNPGTVWVESCVLTPMNTIKASSKTDTRRASLAPVFNQNFKFEVEDEEVTQYLLRLTLYDKHPQNGEKAVGSVIVPLSTVDLCSTETISRDLQ